MIIRTSIWQKGPEHLSIFNSLVTLNRVEYAGVGGISLKLSYVFWCVKCEGMDGCMFEVRLWFEISGLIWARRLVVGALAFSKGTCLSSRGLESVGFKVSEVSSVLSPWWFVWCKKLHRYCAITFKWRNAFWFQRFAKYDCQSTTSKKL